MQHAVLIGYYGQGNLGDELMLICLNQWLKAQDIEITVLAENAAEVAERHGLPAVNNYPFLGQYGWVESLMRGKALGTLSAIRKSDLVLCGGGDLIRDSHGWRTFSFQVEKLVAGLLLRKPVYLLDVGLSTPLTRYGRATLSWLLPRCRGIVVRDARSVEICRRCGCTRQVRLLPDIVRRLTDLCPEARGSAAAQTSVIVALHGEPNVYGMYSMTRERLGALASLLDSVVERDDLDVKFFPFQPEPGGRDAQIARDVQSRMRHAARTRILEWTIDLAEIAARFSRSRLVIAMRLHAAILAATYARPCVLMPYDQKVAEFGKEAQIRDVLTAEMLDDLAKARQIIENSMSRGTAPAPLAPGGDWMALTLKAISGNLMYPAR